MGGAVREEGHAHLINLRVATPTYLSMIAGVKGSVWAWLTFFLPNLFILGNQSTIRVIQSSYHKKLSYMCISVAELR